MLDRLDLTRVLLFRDSEASLELGEALWSALREIESFYNHDRRRIVGRRFYVAETLPTTLAAELGPEERLVPKEGLEQAVWKGARGRYSHTVDQEALAKSVRELLPATARDSQLLLVIDQEITPPEEWPYRIWDRVPDGRVISLKPTDPHYWRAEDGDRVATVKHRVRTACLSAVGRFLGLSRCSNERCFLYRGVSSVQRLDHMVFLGPEHRIPELAKRGFLRRPRRPQALQRVVEAERIQGWW